MFGGVGIGVRRHGSVSYHRTMSAMCVQCLITVPHFVCLLKCSRSRPRGEVAELGPFPSFPHETHVAGLGATFASHVSLRVRRPI